MITLKEVQLFLMLLNMWWADALLEIHLIWTCYGLLRLLKLNSIMKLHFNVPIFNIFLYLPYIRFIYHHYLNISKYYSKNIKLRPFKWNSTKSFKIVSEKFCEITCRVTKSIFCFPPITYKKNCQNKMMVELGSGQQVHFN